MRKRMIGFILLITVLCSAFAGCGVQNKIAESMVVSLCEERDNYIDYDYSTAQYSGDTLTCEGTIHHEFNEYMVIEGEGATEWTFDSKKMDWKCTNEVITMYATLSTNVEGLWGIDQTDGYIRIRNMTSTGFEIYVDDVTPLGVILDEWVYVTLNKYPDGYLDTSELESNLNDGYCKVVYTGITADDDKVAVTFKTNSGGVFWVEVSVAKSDGWSYVSSLYENYRPE